MFTESVVAVSAEPVVELFVAQTPGPADRTLLVIHGGPDWDHTYLREPLAELAGRHRVVLADLRGCGRSTRGLSDDQYTPAAATADLVALLDAFGTPRIDVLGFSYGGLIAQRLVLAAPERVRRLVIASSSVLPVPPDAFDGWHEREERRAPEAAVWSGSSLSGPELTRAAAVAGAGANVWRPEVLPAYLDRLADVHFSGEWMRSWKAGALPTARHTGRGPAARGPRHPPAPAPRPAGHDLPRGPGRRDHEVDPLGPCRGDRGSGPHGPRRPAPRVARRRRGLPVLTLVAPRDCQ